MVQLLFLSMMSLILAAFCTKTFSLNSNQVLTLLSPQQNC